MEHSNQPATNHKKIGKKNKQSSDKKAHSKPDSPPTTSPAAVFPKYKLWSIAAAIKKKKFKDTKWDIDNYKAVTHSDVMEGLCIIFDTLDCASLFDVPEDTKKAKRTVAYRVCSLNFCLRDRERLPKRMETAIKKCYASDNYTGYIE